MDTFSVVGSLASIAGCAIALLDTRFSGRDSGLWRVVASIIILVLSATSLWAAGNLAGITGMLVFIAGVVLAVVSGWQLHRWKSERHVLVFGPNFKVGEYIPDYYKFMAKALGSAKNEIVISGTGFDYSTEAGRRYAKSIVGALEKALRGRSRITSHFGEAIDYRGSRS